MRRFNPLLKAGANPNQARLDGTTLLLIAIQNKHLDVAKYLIKKGALLNDSVKQELIKDENKSLLMIAIEKNSAFFLKCLEENRITLAEGNQDGLTPMMLAAKCGYLNVIEYLVKRNPLSAIFLLNQYNNGATPLWYAMINGHLQTARYLLEKGALLDLGVQDLIIKTAESKQADKNNQAITLTLGQELLLDLAERNSDFYCNFLMNTHESAQILAHPSQQLQKKLFRATTKMASNVKKY